MHIHLGLRHKCNRKEQEFLRSKQGLSNVVHSKYFTFLDKITFIAGIVGPLTVIPQIYEIFSTHQASGVSTTSWILISVVTLPWIFYGIAHKDKTIIASFILWEIVDILVVIGTIIY